MTYSSISAPRASGVAHIGINKLDHLPPPPVTDGMTIYWKNDRPIGHHLRATLGGQLIEKAAYRPPGEHSDLQQRATLSAVSVIICSRDRPDELARCLASFADQTVLPREIIVVDNASKDHRTRDAANMSGVIYIREGRPGLDIARNTGARAASSDIVAYTDDDIVLHPRWLERLVVAFDAPEIMAVTGLVLPAELSSESQLHFETFWSFGQGYARKDFDKALFTGYRDQPFPAWEVGAGASMAFRRELFDKIGFFDERLDVGQAGCSGDSEFWYRVLAHGYTCRYEPGAVAFHYHRKSMQGLSDQIYHYMRGHSAALLVQNERTAIRQNLRRALLTLPSWYIRRVLRRLIRGPAASDLFLKEEVTGYVSGLLFYWRHRKNPKSAAIAPKTSVIIPARNAAATIERTLDCLVSQSDPDWEAVVINDGSCDGTNEIVSGYVARHRRIRTLAGLAQGVSAARNAGLAVARGRRILFLDADDWLSPDFLERMNGALDARPAAVVAYCAWRRVTPDGRLTPPNSDPSVAVAPLERFARSCAVAIHSVLADHSLIRRVGGFDTSLRTCEDWDFWQRLSRLGGEWVHVDRAMSYYRISPNSLTQNVPQMKADARVVITRGFAVDSRVSGAPEALLKGALPGDQYGPQPSYGYFALWCSAFDVGRGLPAAVDSDVLDILAPATSRATDIAKIVLDGVMVGLRSDIEGMTENWSAFAPRLRKLFGLLASSDPAPGSRRKLQYALEILLLKYGALNEPRALDLTLGLQIDLRAPPTTVPSQGIDRLHARLCAGKRVLKILDLGIVGTISPRDWRDIASRELRDRDLLRIATPASVRLLLARRITGAAKMLARRFGRGAGRIERLHEWSEKPRPGSHAEKVRGLLAAEGRAAAHKPVGVTSSPSVRHGTQTARHSDRQEFFEQIFENTDPWDYGSSYEQEKYGLQIDLLPEGEQVAGMELACAEGLFTQMVAPRFRSFLATDISETALARAKVRCASLEQVSFQVLDLATGPLPTELDVIFCSEVLYYLRDEEELVRVAKRLASALRPGGIIITAHAHLLKDSPDRTGFDWEHPYGAKTISAIFAATEGLALESSIETELYRIDRLRRIEEGAARTEPKSQKRAIAAALAPEVARQVVYGGVEARRADLTYAERPTQIPVLMYHSIAEEGPTALARYRTSPKCFDSQLGWLRRNGYHAIGSEELLWFIENRHPFYGRPVLITFDDAFQDFADTAWPLLRRHDFFAEVFVVTDLVGEAARWDDVYGPPAPLMDSDTIAHLHAEGARFGSHLATHSGADGLATLDLIGELARSRAAISGWLERPVQSLAAPYGLSDDRLRRLAREAGFRICFGGREGFTSLTDDPLDLPRIEVRGEWSLSDFKNAIVRHTGEQ